MKILLVGNVAGASRSQLLIQKLIVFQTNKDYTISICGTDFYATAKSYNKKKLTKAHKFFFLMELFLKVGFADIIYLMAMNNHFIKPVLLCNRFWKKKIISDFYISAYDTGLDRGNFKNDTPKSRKQKERFISYDKLILEKSDIVLHLTKGELDYVANLVDAKVDYTKTKIVPLGIEERPRAQPTQSKIFRIAWWGTWIPLHGIENILLAIKFVSEQKANFKLDLFGSEGKDKDFYVDFIKELEIGAYVTVHTDKSFANGKLDTELLYHCDLALGNFGNSQKAEHVITNKIVDAMSMGLTVLTKRNKVLHEFIDEENDLFVCSNDPLEIGATILSIIKDPEESKRRGNNGYHCYKAHFTPQLYTDKVISIIENVF